MYAYARLTGSGLIKTGGGQLGGFIVATGTPTVTIYDNTAGSGILILNGIVTTAGTQYRIQVGFINGCYVVLNGAGDITFMYN